MTDHSPVYVSTGHLPPVQETTSIVEEAFALYSANVDGEVASYIPALQIVPPDLFGICVTRVDGSFFEIGDSRYPFSVQSVSKPFVFALVCEELGSAKVRESIGVNSTGLPFNSVMAVELHQGRPRNPMVNAGAIATTSLVPGSTFAERWSFIEGGLSRFAGRQLEVNGPVYASEASANERNLGLAWLLDSYGQMHSDPTESADLYTRQCSLNVTAVDLSVMGATLANHGVNPITGVQVVSASVCRAVMAVMATAGLYEASGDWLYDCGVPGKSGVGGGIVTTSPGKGGLGTFAPRLDNAGNSVKGQLVARYLSERLGLNLFAS
jgi:glutaminase